MNIDLTTIDQILEPFTPAVVYLFGSAATGRARADSDVDVAFLPDHACDPYAVYQAAQALAAVLHRDVDLVDLSRASAVLKAQVIGTGQRLLVADVQRADEFEMYALSDYARCNEERREVLGQYPDPVHA
jgi:uncharacterized protein